MMCSKDSCNMTCNTATKKVAKIATFPKLAPGIGLDAYSCGKPSKIGTNALFSTFPRKYISVLCR